MIRWWRRWRRHRAPLVGYAVAHPLPPMTVRRLPLSDADRRWRDEIIAAGIFGPDPVRERTTEDAWRYCQTVYDPATRWLIIYPKGD